LSTPLVLLDINLIGQIIKGVSLQHKTDKYMAKCFLLPKTFRFLELIDIIELFRIHQLTKCLIRQNQFLNYKSLRHKNPISLVMKVKKMSD